MFATLLSGRPPFCGKNANFYWPQKRDFVLYIHLLTCCFLTNCVQNACDVSIETWRNLNVSLVPTLFHTRSRLDGFGFRFYYIYFSVHYRCQDYLPRRVRGRAPPILTDRLSDASEPGAPVTEHESDLHPAKPSMCD